MTSVSYAELFRSHADATPDAPALTVVGNSTLTWRQLVDDATRTARTLADLGVGEGDMVTIAFPNSEAFVFTTFACWMLGAIPQPVSAKLPGRELDEIVALADSRVVAGVEAAGDRATLLLAYTPDPALDATALPDAVSPSWKAPTSGGSTGRPKLILAGTPSTTDPDVAPVFSTAGGTIVVPGPLYHNGPFVWAAEQFRTGGHVVVLPRFDPVETLRAVESHAAETLYLVPTMMQRIWKLDDGVRNQFDLSSLTRIWHLAAPCPAWLKEEWIRWMGPERIFELYAGTEAQAATIITGAEWLAKPGSVGRPTAGQMKIVRVDGTDADPGEHGELFMRSAPGTVNYRYVGAEATTTDDGWESLGDMGWIDEDGFVFLGDRKKDMILSGGANIYPAEVEAAIDRHPQVQSCAVIGVPDDDLGERIHAIVHGTDTLDLDDLRRHLADQIVRYKIPRSFELVDEPVRDDAGKVRRSLLAAERR